MSSKFRAWRHISEEENELELVHGAYDPALGIEIMGAAATLKCDAKVVLAFTNCWW